MIEDKNITKSFFSKPAGFHDIQSWQVLHSAGEPLERLMASTSWEVEYFYCTPAAFINTCTYTYCRYLETIGINITYFCREFPLGTYALGYCRNLYNTSPDDLPEGVFRISKLPAAHFGVVTEPFNDADKENTDFRNFITNAQVIVLARKTVDGQYEWSSPVVLPDGRHLQSAWVNAEQYGQGCFEGIVGTKSDDEGIVIVRPEDHARRFQQSAASIALPALPVDTFVQCLQLLTQANADFWPKHPHRRLYYRPYMKGLEGGYRVSASDYVCCCFQLFTYGALNNDNAPSGMNILGITGKRRSHEGGMGTVKVSGNYAQTIVDRDKAKAGDLYDLDEKFADTFYLGDQVTTRVNEQGETERIITEVLDECSAGNLLFLFKRNDRWVMVTPSLERKSFLPGITADTLVHIAASVGIETERRNIPYKELSSMRVGMIAGSAIGLEPIRKIRYGNDAFHYLNNAEDEAIFLQLRNLFIQVRKGMTTLPQVPVIKMNRL